MVIEKAAQKERKKKQDGGNFKRHHQILKVGTRGFSFSELNLLENENPVKQERQNKCIFLHRALGFGSI